MLTVTALDPADSLIRGWIQRRLPPPFRKVVEIGGRYGFASVSLVSDQLELSFEVRCDSQDFLRRGESMVRPEDLKRISFSCVPSLFNAPPQGDVEVVWVYVIRNLFWNWTDIEAAKLLQTLLPVLRDNPFTRILVTDGVSPLPDDFPSHVEIAYRRRDITTMTMHNVKQRSQAEWLELFTQVDPALKASFVYLVWKGNTTNIRIGRRIFRKQLACM